MPRLSAARTSLSLNLSIFLPRRIHAASNRRAASYQSNELKIGIATIAAPSIMKAGTAFPAKWQQQIFVHHRFGHSDYHTYIGA